MVEATWLGIDRVVKVAPGWDEDPRARPKFCIDQEPGPQEILISAPSRATAEGVIEDGTSGMGTAPAQAAPLTVIGSTPRRTRMRSGRNRATPYRLSMMTRIVQGRLRFPTENPSRRSRAS